MMAKISLNLIPSTKHGNQRQEHNVCKTKMQMKNYFDNILNHEHEMKWTQLWCTIVPHIGVEQIKGNGVVFIFIYTPLRT